jgi:PAS domain S-box-containing protein
MRKTDHDAQDNRSSDVRGRNFRSSTARRENSNPPEQGQAGSVMTTRLPPSSDLLNLGSQTPLIELFPMAAYAVRAPDGVIVWFNSRAAQLWGRVPALNDTDERFCGAHKLYYPDGTHMAHCDTPVALALRTGTSVHEQEVVVEKPDGSRVSVSVYIDPIRDQDGAIVGVVNFFHDIHERKQAERTTGLLAAIVNSSDDAIVSKSLDGIITSWNRSAERLFGYAAEEAIGQHISLIVPPDRRSEEMGILEKLRRGERVDHFETVRLRKNGTRLDISLTISPLKDSSGRVVGASKVARDISERKRAEEAHKEAELSARLRQVQDEERRRIARELHDGVGQLLSAVGMNVAQVMRERDKLSPAAARSADDMRHSIERASAEIRTVSYLLHPPMLDEIGLQTALRWYADGFAERSKIQVPVEVTSDFPRLIQDYELSLFRIAQECLTNIHRHSGSFTAFVRLSCADGKIELEVRDEGKGLNQEIQSKLNAGASVGVGFRGMQERVRLIGGKLTVHSSGNGTSVLVTLPLNEEALAPSQNTALNPDAAGDESRDETKPAVRSEGLSL